MKVNLERDLNEKKRQLETLTADTQRLEGECNRDQGQLDEAMDLLLDNKHTLAQEEKKEIEAKKQLEQQQVRVDSAETLIRQRERDEGNALNDYDQAIRDEQVAQVNLNAAETEMERLKEILRTAAVAGIAFAWTLIGGLVGLGTALATESAIRDHTSQLNACKQQLNSRSRIREQKYQSHQTAMGNTHQAREMFATEEATLESRRSAWQQQIEVKSTAQHRVGQQAGRISRAELKLAKLKECLATAEGKQRTEEVQVNQAKSKLGNQNEHVDQLEQSVESLHTQQTTAKSRWQEGIQAKANAEQQLAQVNGTKVNATNVLEVTHRELTAIRSSVQHKDRDLREKQSELVVKERTSVQAKNKLTAIHDDLNMAKRTVAELQQELAQQDPLLRAERAKQVRLVDEQRSTAARLDSATHKRNATILQINELKDQLQAHNQATVAKTVEVKKSQAAVESKRQIVYDTQDRNRETRSGLDRIRRQIDENERHLQGKEGNIRTLMGTLTEKQADIQVSI